VDEKTPWIRKPPSGLAIVALLGPSLIWCAEYIGSGEVILATRTGAILGSTVLWAVIVGIFLKYWIGMSGARYTACTGEGMVDMFDRMPGPGHWVVWIVLVGQLICAIMSIGSVASAGAAFLSSLLGIDNTSLCGWIIVGFAFLVAWSGLYDVLKLVMSILIFVVVIGVLYVAVRNLPGLQTLLENLRFETPPVPDWAIAQGASDNPWAEVLPLIGWGAGGFASQVWYTYWVLGAGYGACAGRNYGEPADVSRLRKMTRSEAGRIKGWCRVLYADATLALVIGTVVTGGFLLAGATILRPEQLAPQSDKLAESLSRVFSADWGATGAFLFKLAGTAALAATSIGHLAGWPRLLSDSARICIPGFQKKFPWKVQFRMLLVFFFTTSMIIVYSLGKEPVFLVKISAILDGLLLTPLQAVCVGIALFVIMPKILSKEAAKILKPHWIFAVGLVVAFLVFSYFCIFQIPREIAGRNKPPAEPPAVKRTVGAEELERPATVLRENAGSPPQEKVSD